MTSEDVRASGPGSRTRRAGAWLKEVAAENAGGAVYGTVMVGVLLAAEDPRHEGYPDIVGAAAIVLVLYWLMSLYTQTLGIRLRSRGRLSLTLFRQTCAHELAIVEGAAIPLIALLAAWALGASVPGGVAAALWATAASIVRWSSPRRGGRGCRPRTCGFRPAPER